MTGSILKPDLVALVPSNGVISNGGPAGEPKRRHASRLLGAIGHLVGSVQADRVALDLDVLALEIVIVVPAWVLRCECNDRPTVVLAVPVRVFTLRKQPTQTHPTH